MRRTGYQRRQTGGSGKPSSGKATARPPGRIRIIAGRFRGRRIPVVDLPGLRPTPERTRETLFNWLQGHLDGARVLDLFAGSGALGFEALSRGASEVVLVEKDRRACQQLREVAASLDQGRCRVVQADALAWPRSQEQAFDLILIDPPFAASLAVAALAHVHARKLLAAGGRVYCEASTQEMPAPWEPPESGPPESGPPESGPPESGPPESGRWEVLRETDAGDSHGALLALASGEAKKSAKNVDVQK